MNSSIFKTSALPQPDQCIQSHRKSNSLKMLLSVAVLAILFVTTSSYNTGGDQSGCVQVCNGVVQSGGPGGNGGQGGGQGDYWWQKDGSAFSSGNRPSAPAGRPHGGSTSSFSKKTVTKISSGSSRPSTHGSSNRRISSVSSHGGSGSRPQHGGSYTSGSRITSSSSSFGAQPNARPTSFGTGSTSVHSKQKTSNFGGASAHKQGGFSGSSGSSGFGSGSASKPGSYGGSSQTRFQSSSSSHGNKFGSGTLGGTHSGASGTKFPSGSSGSFGSAGSGGSHFSSQTTSGTKFPSGSSGSFGSAGSGGSHFSSQTTSGSKFPSGSSGSFGPAGSGNAQFSSKTSGNKYSQGSSGGTSFGSGGQNVPHGSSFSGTSGSSFNSGNRGSQQSGAGYSPNQGSIGQPSPPSCRDPQNCGGFGTSASMLQPTGVQFGNMMMMMMPMGVPVLGQSCSASNYCVAENTCNPYNGFIIRDVSQIPAAFPDSPQVPRVECFVPGSSLSGRCCQEPHPIAGGAD